MSHLRPTAREVLLELDAESIVLRERDAMEKRFFNQIVLSNGTLKTTSSGRLTDLNDACNRLLKRRCGKTQILDVAISSGVTTAEWMESLDGAGVDYHLDAFDLCLDGSIYSITPWFHALCDSAGVPLQFEILGVPLGNYFGNTLLLKAKRVIPVLATRVTFGAARRFLGEKVKRQPVQLVSHRLRNSEKMRLFECDVARVSSIDRKYDLIRAANILNVEYFDERFIADAVRQLVDRLDEQGILCIVRTHIDGSNHATIFRKSDESIEVVQRLGAGSEIEKIVLRET